MDTRAYAPTEAAARWQTRTQAGGASDGLLVRGEDLAAAKAWAARRKEGAPEITPLLAAFLAASGDRAAALEDEKRRELAERERLVAESERAQRDTRRVQRRSFVLLTALPCWSCWAPAPGSGRCTAAGVR